MRDSFSRLSAASRAALAQQIRTSTGFTWARAGAVVSGPRLAVVRREVAPPARRVAVVPTVRPEAVAAPVAAVVVPEPIAAPPEPDGAARARMMRALAAWPADRPLARTAELAEIAGIVRPHMTPSMISSRVTTVLREAQERGLIEVWSQAVGAHRGERAVLLRRDGRVLATEGAPAVWTDDLRRRAALAAGLVGGK